MNLQKLQSQRNGTKRIIQRYIEKLEEARLQECMVEFEATLESVENKFSGLQAINENILAQTEADAIEDEMLEEDEFSLNIEIKLRQFRIFRDTHSSIQGRDTRQLPSFTSVSMSSNTAHFSRLPKLTLPKFDGDLLKWQSFWDSFESSINSNMNLSDVQKFSYLKAQLEGEADMTVEGFALTNGNYIRAVELLRERYGQQHKIIHATMQALLNLSAPTSSVRSLRNFYDKMETYIRGLESLGQNQETYGSLLVPIVIDKLPIDIRKNLVREKENNDWNIRELRRAINKEINILDTGSSNPRPEVHVHDPTALFYTGTKERNNSRRPNPTSSNSQQKRRPPIKCAFCENNHHSNECRTFSDIDSRLTVVKQKQLCFNCLGKHHFSHCTSKRTCRFCNKRHNSSICSKNTAFQNLTSNRPEAAILYANARDNRPDVLLKLP